MAGKKLSVDTVREGTMTELSMGVMMLKVEWVSGESSDGIKFDSQCGAGVGSALARGSDRGPALRHPRAGLDRGDVRFRRRASGRSRVMSEIRFSEVRVLLTARQIELIECALTALTLHPNGTGEFTVEEIAELADYLEHRAATLR